MTLAEHTAWSPVLGCEATRISLADDQGQEFFAIIPRSEGRAWREAKREALGYLEQAIDMGLKPGEVRWKRDDRG